MFLPDHWDGNAKQQPQYRIIDRNL